MSGFDKDWLALREPADRAARHTGLPDDLARHLGALERAHILDIGCGTGSTWRSLNDRLPGQITWTLLDHDPALLDEAQRRIGEESGIAFRQHDLNDIATLPLEDASVVTASALFDLSSERFCTALVERLASARIGLYAALNYDGVMHWSLPHPLDGQMVDLFNRHQRTDKGFGTALGPDATACLARLLTAHGFSVRIEDSPWRMDSRTAALQAEFLHGLRRPLLEMSALSKATVDGWLEFRLSAIGQPGSSCLVGHTDLLALPV